MDLSGFGYDTIGQIGKGQYAQAHLVQEKANGTKYVAKCVSLAALNDHDQELAHQEAFLLQNLSHPTIVGYQDAFLLEGENTLVIVMEHCDGGDLRQAIKEKAKAGQNFSEDQIMGWFVQLCLALQYIHSEKVLHRDLKTSNIFLSEGGSVIKLGDFGISRILEGTTEAAVTIVGTPYYMSPEVCRSEPYNFKSDVWALGCVLYELCMLKHAFESSSLLGLVYKIVSDHYEPIPAFYSEQLNDLIRQLLMKNAESRPSINELFALPFVKAHLGKQTVQAPAAAPAEPEQPCVGARRRARTLRQDVPREKQGVSAAPGAYGALAVVPASPQLGPKSSVHIMAARIRRRLVAQKLHWVSAFALFDEDGRGLLKPEAMRSALLSMHLGLSEAEIMLLTSDLVSEEKVSLDAFNVYLIEVTPAVQECERWARQVLAPAGKNVRRMLHSKDVQQQGTLAPAIFQEALKELVPSATPSDLDLLLLLADKNGLGDVDYIEFLNAFAPPLAPGMASSAPSPPIAAPPGMPPLHVGAPPGPTTPAGMPPLTLGTTSKNLNLTLSGTVSLGDVLVTPRTFFTCTSQDLAGPYRITFSNDGCALVFSRIQRRLQAVGLLITDALALFVNPGEKSITAEQCLEVASTLPLGVSKAEMQQLFQKVNSDGADQLPLAVLKDWAERVQASDSSTPPQWILGAVKRGLLGRLRDELQSMCAAGAPCLAREADFRKVVMQSEGYLTGDQLNCLVLMADKSANGQVDFQEFADRFAGDGKEGPLRLPGGLLPPVGASAMPVSLPPEEDIIVVASRVAAVLDRHDFLPGCLPQLLGLWGGDLDKAMAATLLVLLPLGMSKVEVAIQLEAAGSLEHFVDKLKQVHDDGVWRGQCEWASSNIPGDTLRGVLQRQVIEAETRTVDPTEFVQALTGAGVTAPNIQRAMCLAEKTAQGDIHVASFLTNFGGPPPPAQKKKRGMLNWMLRR